MPLVFSFLVLLALITTILASDVFAESASRTGPLGFGFAELHEPMETDRPDFTEGTRTIQPGHFQVELGYGYTYDDDTDLKEHGIGEALFRIGLVNIAELRFSLAGYQDVEEGSVSSYGTSDLTVGTKIRVFEACDCNFDVSALVELTLPTGSEDLSQDDVSPKASILWAYGWDESSSLADFSLAGNFNFDVPVEDSDYYFEPSASLAFGYSLTESLGTYLEYFGFYPSGGNAPSTVSTHFLNAGLTYGLTENLQLDLLVGMGINDSAEDFFTGCGVSFRL